MKFLLNGSYNHIQQGNVCGCAWEWSDQQGEKLFHDGSGPQELQNFPEMVRIFFNCLRNFSFFLFFLCKQSRWPRRNDIFKQEVASLYVWLQWPRNQPYDNKCTRTLRVRILLATWNSALPVASPYTKAFHTLPPRILQTRQWSCSCFHFIGEVTEG